VTYECSEVDHALLRELEQGIDRIEALAKKDWPVRLECSRLRAFVAALRKEPPPAKVPPLRKLAVVGGVKFDLVQTSGVRPSDEAIERAFVERDEP